MKTAIKMLLAAVVVMAWGPVRAEMWEGSSGSQSGIREFRQAVIKDQAAWRAVWAQHQGDGSQPPVVDFAGGESVVGVFLGERPTAGCRIDLEGQPRINASGELQVLFRETCNEDAAPQVSFPFALRRMQTGEASLSVVAVGADQDPAPIGKKADRAAVLAGEFGDSLANLSAAAASPRVMTAAFDGNSRTPGDAPVVLAALAAGPISSRMLLKVGCTPGVDCPLSASPPSRSRCTPGVDCPSTSPRRPGSGSSCTPGVDCPGTVPSRPRCTPGVDCPGDGRRPGGGGTPLPPNYRPRPTRPPRSYTPPPNIGWYDREARSGWREHNFLGFSLVDYGSWKETTGSATIERGGTETGISQGVRYVAPLKSRRYRNRYKRYYRHVGRDCNDYGRCRYWDVEYAWFRAGTDDGRTRFMDVTLRFENDDVLLPWEKERFRVSFKGGRVSLEQVDTAFRYLVDGPVVDQRRGTAVISLTPQSRRLRLPEKNKVSLSLQKDGSQLFLVVTDNRTEVYDGEMLEIRVRVKWDKPWSWNNPVVFERKKSSPLQFRVQAGEREQRVQVPANKSGEYWISNWRFRRAESEISRDDWINKGKGNTVKR